MLLPPWPCSALQKWTACLHILAQQVQSLARGLQRILRLKKIPRTYPNVVLSQGARRGAQSLRRVMSVRAQVFQGGFR